MNKILFLGAFVLLVACDKFLGPNVRSEFALPVKLTATYSDGETFSHEWPPCRVFSLGAIGMGRFGVKAKEPVTLESVVIEAEGKVIHRFDKAQIESLLRQEEAVGGHPTWVVDESGVHFSRDSDCPMHKSGAAA